MKRAYLENKMKSFTDNPKWLKGGSIPPWGSMLFIIAVVLIILTGSFTAMSVEEYLRHKTVGTLVIMIMTSLAFICVVVEVVYHCIY